MYKFIKTLTACVMVLVTVSDKLYAQTPTQYALELSAPCTMTVYDKNGVAQHNVTEPVGYVTQYQWWQGMQADVAQGDAMTPPEPAFSSLYPETDPCGNPWDPVPVVDAVPADGSGGVALP